MTTPKDELIPALLPRHWPALIDSLTTVEQVKDVIDDWVLDAVIESEPPPGPGVTLMPAGQFDALLRSLDVADDAPALAKAVERSRGPVGDPCD